MLFAMRNLMLALVLTMSAAKFGVAETAEEIIQRFELEKAAALEEYLAQNPTPEDAEVAESALINAYGQAGEVDKMAELLTKVLKQMPTGAELPPQDYLSTLQVLLQVKAQQGEKEEAQALLAQAEKDVSGHPMEAQIKEFLTQLGGEFNQPGVGDTLEIAFTSMNGEEIDLAKMKGKVVLVDYWATWCGPCITELPNLKAAYEAYHDQGFEVIGISLDEDKEALEAFLKEREMPWPQDFTGEGWATPLAQKYGINSIPATFLIGKEGKIVATDLRGSALKEAVEKALGEN